MSDKSLRQFSEDIEQRRAELRQRSSDTMTRFKQKSAASGDALAKRRADLVAKTKKAAADAVARKKSQDQQRADAKAASAEKQKMKDDIKKEIESERQEKREDNEERRQSKEKKRMSKERSQQVLDTTG